MVPGLERPNPAFQLPKRVARLVKGDATVERIDDEPEDDGAGGVTSVGGAVEPFSLIAVAMIPLEKFGKRR